MFSIQLFNFQYIIQLNSSEEVRVQNNKPQGNGDVGSDSVGNDKQAIKAIISRTLQKHVPSVNKRSVKYKHIDNFLYPFPIHNTH